MMRYEYSLTSKPVPISGWRKLCTHGDTGRDGFVANYLWFRSAGDGEIGLNSCHSELPSGHVNTHTLNFGFMKIYDSKPR